MTTPSPEPVPTVTTSPWPTVPATSLSDTAISMIRTLVPLGWGFVVSWLVGLGLPAALLASAGPVVVSAITAVVAGLWYALWRWVEPKIPAWLVKVVLGYSAVPKYTGS